MTVHGTGRVRGGQVTIDVRLEPAVSGLLLAGPDFDHGITVAMSARPAERRT